MYVNRVQDIVEQMSITICGLEAISFLFEFSFVAILLLLARDSFSRLVLIVMHGTF
jgi:hypothetical protein